jgi:phosphoribosylanthranilate isomerase
VSDISRVRVKICGITNWLDARAACDAGADALGFNFYAKSPRVISPAAAWDMRKKLPPFVAAVGVFVNWKAGPVNSLAASLQLSAAQLHGDETPQVAAEVARRVPVIKAFRIRKDFSLAQLAKFAAAAAILLDGAQAGQYGGTGKTTDWALADKAARKHRIILSGGLNPENVAEAIRAVRPYAVDVASGVESRPGKKDAGKLREFLREVERASRELAGL